MVVDKNTKFIAIIATFLLLLLVGGLFFKFGKTSPDNSTRNEEISENKSELPSQNKSELPSENKSELSASLSTKYKPLLEATPPKIFSLKDSERLDRLKLLVKLLETESPKDQKKLAQVGELAAAGGLSILKSFIEAYTANLITCEDITNCISVCENTRQFRDLEGELYVSFGKIQASPGDLLKFFPPCLAISYTEWFSELTGRYAPFLECSDVLSLNDPLLLQYFKEYLSSAIQKGILEAHPPSPLAQKLMDWVEDGQEEKYTALRIVVITEEKHTPFCDFPKKDLNAIRDLLAVFGDLFPYSHELFQNIPNNTV
jgi:hypothetical protein